MEEEKSAAAKPAEAPSKPAPAAPAETLPPLNAAERKELLNIETKIHAAEEAVTAIERQMEDPAVAVDAKRLQECWQTLPVAKAEVDRLYARWEELESRRR